MAILRKKQARIGESIDSNIKRVNKKVMKKIINALDNKYENLSEFKIHSIDNNPIAGWVYMNIEYSPSTDNEINIDDMLTEAKDINKDITKELDNIMNTSNYTMLENKLSQSDKYTLRVETKLDVLIKYLEDNM